MVSRSGLLLPLLLCLGTAHTRSVSFCPWPFLPLHHLSRVRGAERQWGPGVGAHPGLGSRSRELGLQHRGEGRGEGTQSGCGPGPSPLTGGMTDGRMDCRQDATHQPNTQTSANNSGRRERWPDPTMSPHSVVYFNQPNNSNLCNLMYICYSQPGTARVPLCTCVCVVTGLSS